MSLTPNPGTVVTPAPKLCGGSKRKAALLRFFNETLVQQLCLMPEALCRVGGGDG